MLKLSKNMGVFPGVKLSLLSSLEELKLEEQGQELVIALHIVNVDVKQCLYALEALGELAHRCIVHGVSFMDVLLAKDLPHSVNQVSCVLFKYTLNPYVEFLMPLDGVSVVKDC